jgi:hypothetical protein
MKLTRQEIVKRLTRTLVTVSLAGGLLGASPAERQKPTSPAAQEQRVSACSLLPRAEVRKILPWPDLLDQFKDEEEPIGATGSGCSFPSVYVQILSYGPTFLKSLRDQGEKLEPAPGVGDDAYLRDNKGRWAELYAKVGDRILTLQAGIPPGKKADDLKPALVALGKAYAAKLR